MLVKATLPSGKVKEQSKEESSNHDDIRSSNISAIDGQARQRQMSMVQPGTIIENKPLYEEVYRFISYNDAPALK
jgi:hypothetical protein